MPLTAEEYTEMASLAADVGDEQAELEALEGLESVGGMGAQPDFVGASVIEPVRAVGSAVGRTIAGGLAGTAQALNPFAEQGAGAATVAEFQEGTFQPETQAGQEGLQTLGALIEKGADIINIPLSGIGGILELVSGQGIDQAVETIKAIQGQGLAKTAGEREFETSGSPLRATAVETAVGALPAFGAKGAFSAARSGASPVVETVGKGLTPIAEATGKGVATVAKGGREVVEVAGDIFSRQSPTKQRIAEKLLAGEFDRDTAGFTLEAPKKAAPTEAGQAAPDVAPRVQASKLEREALKQGFDKGVIASIKGAKGPDRAKFRQMVNIMERSKNNARFAADNRPSDVLGNSLMTRVEILQRANFRAGKDIDRVASTLENKQVDISDAVHGFSSSLDNLGVRIINGKPDFELSQLSPGDRGPIREVIRQMKVMGRDGIDGLSVHKMKRGIDNNVTFGRSKTGISGDAERALKSFRTSLDDTLDSNFSEYNKINEAYSKTIRGLDELQEVAGKKLDLSGPNANKATGTLLRRVLSNAQSRIALLDSVDEIERLAKEFEHFKTGKADPRLIEGPTPPTKIDDDLLNQILFVDELDAQFGTTARTSFQGQIQQGIEQAAQATVSPVGAALKAGAVGVEKLRNINEEGAFKAIKELLAE